MLALPWSSGAEARRLALVIGNDDYQSATPLHNARADAKAVATALKRDGFDVTLKENLTLKAMKDALRSFKDQISGGDEAVFYFSGHGVQFGGTNYLIPTDLVPQSEEQVADDSVPLQRVLDDLRDQKTRFALAIIDACRDNPFKGTGREIGGRGLAPVTAATGQMVLYSAGAGQEALDRLGPHDPDSNGVFTRVLIREIVKPGVPAEQVLRNVRDQVVELARGVDHEQVPALYDQSIGEFYFVAGPAPPAPPAPIPSETAKPFLQLAATRDADARQKMEQQLWEQLRQSLSKPVLYGYLESKKDGPQRVLGFVPAAATSDGRTAMVRTEHGELNHGSITYDDANNEDVTVDCVRNEFVIVRYANHGSVRYLDEAQRKAETHTIQPELGVANMAEALCGMPLRITPLWGLESIEWTDLGRGSSAALKIRWSDPQHPNEQYALNRRVLEKPTEEGWQVEYGWIGINCATQETRDTGYFEASAQGEVIGVQAAAVHWQQFEPNSPAANFHVLVCERQ
jgi:hypothetical protein